MASQYEEVFDLREEGEAFCAACPDHEACMSGYPCSLVQRINQPKED
jgi:hypothetical protein